MKKVITFFKDWIWQGLLGFGMLAIGIFISTIMVKISWTIIVFTWGIW